MMLRVLLAICINVFVIVTLPALAEDVAEKDLPNEIFAPKYPVILGNRVLFYIPATLKDFNPKVRAETISRRLSESAENPLLSFDTVSIKDFNDPITMVLAGNEILFGILNEDAEFAGTTRYELAMRLSGEVKTTVDQYRKERLLKEIIKGGVLFAVETILLIAVLFFSRRLYLRVMNRMNVWVEAKKLFLENQSLDIVRIDKISFFLLGILKAVWLIVILGFIYIYIQMGLSFFPWTQALAAKLLGFVLLPLTTIFNAFWGQVPNLFFLAVISLITIYILKPMRLFFRGIEAGQIKFTNFYREWAQPTHGVIRILIIAFALVVAFPYIPGSNSLAFKGISIFFGVLLSIGSSTAVANILAGYMIIYRRVFSVGDRIKINDIIGDVIETRLQVIHLRTLKNEDLSVPNSVVVNSQVLNYNSLANKHGLILHTTVSIGYDTPWRKVHAMLLEVADRVEGIMKKPVPFILQKSLDDFYVTYELNVYTNDPQKMGVVYSAIHQNILDVFNEHGVQIMSPHYITDKSEPVLAINGKGSDLPI